MNLGEHKRQSILAGFNMEIEKGDENHFSTPEAFYKAANDNKWLVYSEEDILKFEKAIQDELNNLEKGGDETSKEEILEKAKKDLSKLTKKIVIDKRGFAVKRWVANGGENAVQSSEDTKQSHQQLLDEKISKKSNKQMEAHREDLEDEHEKMLNDLAHEVVDKKAEYEEAHSKMYAELLEEHKSSKEFNKKYDAWVKENAPKYGISND